MPFSLALIPLGIFEIIDGANLLKAVPEKPKWPKGLAILEIVAGVLASLPSAVVGILILVFLSRDDARSFMAGMGVEGFN